MLKTTTKGRSLGGGYHIYIYIYMHYPCPELSCIGTVPPVEQVYHTDPRWKHLLSKCATIEAMLKVGAVQGSEAVMYELSGHGRLAVSNHEPGASCQASDSVCCRRC